jgi:hypothetical protein
MHPSAPASDDLLFVLPGLIVLGSASPVDHVAPHFLPNINDSLKRPSSFWRNFNDSEMLFLESDRNIRERWTRMNLRLERTLVLVVIDGLL